MDLKLYKVQARCSATIRGRVDIYILAKDLAELDDIIKNMEKAENVLSIEVLANPYTWNKGGMYINNNQYRC